ncbi:MAG: endospore germination permease [Bacillota bacterium]
MHNRQLLLMLFIIRSTVSIATLPVLTTGEAAQDAWASSLLVVPGTVLIVLLVGGLGIKFKEMTVVEYSAELLGRPLGAVVSSLFLLVFLHFAATDIRVYAEVLISGFTPKTPIPFIVGIVIALAVIASQLGIETIGRMADVLTPLFVLFIALGILGCLVTFDIQHLEPVLSRGSMPIISGALTPTALGAKYLTLAMLIPNTTKPSKALTYAVVSVLLSGVVLIAVATSTVAVLGADLSRNTVFPFFKALRSVRITQLIQRIEALAVISWGYGVFIDVSLLLYSGAKGLSQLLGLDDYRVLLLPLAVIWGFYAVESHDTLLELMHVYRPSTLIPFVTVMVFVPYIVLWIAYLIRVRRSHGESG